MYVCVYMSCMCERGWSKVGGTEMGEQTEQRCVCGCVDVLLCVYERKGIGCVCVCVCVCVAGSTSLGADGGLELVDHLVEALGEAW